MIGIDVVSLNRIKKTCDCFGDKFLSRFLSLSEIALCTKENQTLNFQRIAGFWSAKEAISKALGVGIGEELSFLDILLDKDSKGKPCATLKKYKLKQFKIHSIALSITHDEGLAIAVAWIEKHR